MTPELTTAEVTAPADTRREEEVSARDQHSDERNDGSMALFPEDQVGELRARWDQIQAGFVDEPRGAVEKADALVAETISKLAEGFARTRAQLDQQWKRGDAVSTEDFRQALRQYRSFFTRLLKA